MQTRDRFGPLIGSSPAMRRLFDRLDRIVVAARDAPSDWVIRGEDGTGKRTVASAIHAITQPKSPIVTLDCPSIPSELCESALFGHTRGSFTGVVTTKKGVFEEADQGSVILREFTAIDPEVQPRLLRTLVERRIRRVGENTFLPIAMTHIFMTTRYDLATLVAQGRLHRGLYDRVMREPSLDVPRLAERVGDLPLLLRHFIGDGEAAASLSLTEKTIARLEKLVWRGNVAELERFAADLRGGAHDDDDDGAVTERELLEAIWREPDDDDSAARIVYGDLLLSRGDPRGELIQVQCRAAAAAATRKASTAEERRRLAQAERELLAAHGETWRALAIDALGPIASDSTPPIVELRRGFIESVETELTTKTDALLRAIPTLTDLGLIRTTGYWRRTLARSDLASPRLEQLRRLRLNVWGMEDAAAVILAACPWLRGLRELVVFQKQPKSRAARQAGSGRIFVLGADGARALGSASHLTLNLRSLALEGLRLDGTGMTAFLEAMSTSSSPSSSWNLERLVLRDNRIGDEGAKAIAGASCLRSLRSLDLSKNNLDDGGFVALAASEHLSGLEELHLEEKKILSPVARKAFRRSTSLAKTAIRHNFKLVT